MQTWGRRNFASETQKAQMIEVKIGLERRSAIDGQVFFGVIDEGSNQSLGLEG